MNNHLNHEIKGKTLGIVGYGQVGVQVSVLAESLGMNVIFYDSDMKLNIGNSRQILKLSDLLFSSDIILLSTPPFEHPILTENELYSLKHGSSLINISGYNTIDLEPLVHLLQDHTINCLVMDLDAGIPTEVVNKVKGKLCPLSNVCITSGELCRTTESLQKISKHAVESVLDYLAKTQAASTLSSYS